MARASAGSLYGGGHVITAISIERPTIGGAVGASIYRDIGDGSGRLQLSACQCYSRKVSPETF